MVGTQQRVNVIGPVADHIAYGLPNSSSEILTTIPLAYPMTPELLEDQRMLIEETKNPGIMTALTEYSQQKPILNSLILATITQPVNNIASV